MESVAPPDGEPDLPAIPTRHITAAALTERCGIDVVGIPLLDLWQRPAAYCVHCGTGPYLMTVKEWEIYHHKHTQRRKAP